MLLWATTFAILAIGSGVLGFQALAGAAALAAKIVCGVCLVLLAAGFVVRALRS